MLDKLRQRYVKFINGRNPWRFLAGAVALIFLLLPAGLLGWLFARGSLALAWAAGRLTETIAPVGERIGRWMNSKTQAAR